MNNQIWFDAIGWLGATALLVAYAMVSSRKMEADSALYQLLNIVGSLLLVANTIFYRAYPSSFVNLIWAGIAVFSIATRRRIASQDTVTKG
jgi:hypothetical protein